MQATTAIQDEFCDSQPVVQGGIQTFGILFVLSRELTILQASVNVETVLGMASAELLGKNLAELISVEARQALESAIDDGDLRRLNGWELELRCASGARRFGASVSGRASHLLMELEIEDAGADPLLALMMRNRLSRLSIDLMHCRSFSEMYDKTTTELRSILGVDKVMVYRFDEQWNGTVLAESKAPAMESYLGLRFPATDIPEPARRLYASNPIRMIPDARYAPVRLEPALNPLSGKPSELGSCIQRGVAPVHLEYLNNMQVTASISVSIKHEGALWGLIALHHRAPLTLHASVRAALELLSECFATKLSMLQASESQQGAERLVGFQKTVASAVQHRNAPLPVVLQAIEETSHFLEAQGVAVLLEGDWFIRGDTPSREELATLATWLQKKDALRVYATQSLASEYEGGEAIRHTASGLLAVSITGRFEDVVMWFRPEVAQVVTWGGDPGQTLQFDADQKNYHPRRSFKAWKETVVLHSSPWSARERSAANAIRLVVAEAMLDLRSARLKTLRGIVPICAHCKMIRDEKDTWRVMEEYIQSRSKATFSHGLCPDCFASMMKAEGLQDA